MPRVIWRCRICGGEVVVASRRGHLHKVHPEVFRESTTKEVQAVQRSGGPGQPALHAVASGHLENRIMHALRVGPAMIERLERKIDLDRDDLRRVRNDLASEMGPTGFLRMRERALVRRIELNTERLHQLQAEVSATREKIAGVTS